MFIYVGVKNTKCGSVVIYCTGPWHQSAAIGRQGERLNHGELTSIRLGNTAVPSNITDVIKYTQKLKKKIKYVKAKLTVDKFIACHFFY